MESEVTVDWRLAGGVSTLESGFTIGWIENAPDDYPLICVAANSKGEPFAKFMRDKTVETRSDLSRAEREAVQGIKHLILGW